MAIRLIVTIDAAPGKGTELGQAYRGRCAEVMAEPGCEQFEVFQSVVNPDKLAMLERWTDQAALDAHSNVNNTRPALSPSSAREHANAKTTSTTGPASQCPNFGEWENFSDRLTGAGALE